jgi:hypothetical protein
LIPQLIIPPGATTERLIPCIGDEELIRVKIGTISIPTTPKLAIDNKIEVNHFTLTMTNRRKNEMKMIEVYSKMLNIKETSAVQVISRKLKLGIFLYLFQCSMKYNHTSFLSQIITLLETSFIIITTTPSSVINIMMIFINVLIFVYTY